MHPVLPGSPLEMAKLTAKLAVMVEAAKAEAEGETEAAGVRMRVRWISQPQAAAARSKEGASPSDGHNDGTVE